MLDYNCMSLAKLRKKSKLTQKEAAELIGVPYRTYVRYEEEPSYRDSYKYKMFVSELENKVRIDEEHGILSLEAIKQGLIPILKKHKISYCYLFGSYAYGKPRENSDIDLLIDTKITGLEFFNLVEEIRTSLHKKVDLLRLADLKSDNPIVLEILKTGIRLI